MPTDSQWVINISKGTVCLLIITYNLDWFSGMANWLSFLLLTWPWNQDEVLSQSQLWILITTERNLVKTTRIMWWIFFPLLQKPWNLEPHLTSDQFIEHLNERPLSLLKYAFVWHRWCYINYLRLLKYSKCASRKGSHLIWQWHCFSRKGKQEDEHPSWTHEYLENSPCLSKRIFLFLLHEN